MTPFERILLGHGVLFCFFRLTLADQLTSCNTTTSGAAPPAGWREDQQRNAEGDQHWSQVAQCVWPRGFGIWSLLHCFADELQHRLASRLIRSQWCHRRLHGEFRAKKGGLDY